MTIQKIEKLPVYDYVDRTPITMHVYNELAKAHNKMADVLNSLTEEKEEYCRYCHTRPCEEEKKTCYYKCEIGNCKSPHCGRLCSCKSVTPQDSFTKAYWDKIQPQEEKGEAWQKTFESRYINLDEPDNEGNTMTIFSKEDYQTKILPFIKNLLSTTAEKARQEEQQRIVEVIAGFKKITGWGKEDALLADVLSAITKQ